MTNEERDKAIRILQWLHDNKFLFGSTEEDVKYATKLAIQELEQESCGDAVSRQAVDDILCLYSDKNGMIDARGAVRMVRELPSVKPLKPLKPLGEEMRITQKAITDEKVLIGFNMAVALCNKHLRGDDDGR